jgi:hypothetical protein
MNSKLSPLLAVLGLVWCFLVKADGTDGLTVATGQGTGRPKAVEPPGSIEKEAEAKMLVREAALLISNGGQKDAEKKARQAVAIDPRRLSGLRFDLECYDEHPQMGPLMLFASIERQAKEDLVLATDETNKFDAIKLPKLEATEGRRRFESAVSQVLEEHGFTTPFFVEKPGALWVAFSARPRLKPLGEAHTTSAYEVLQAQIETTPDGHVTLELVPYAWIGSDYAILGKIFQIPIGITRERAEIAKQIQAELDHATR